MHTLIDTHTHARTHAHTHTQTDGLSEAKDTAAGHGAVGIKELSRDVRLLRLVGHLVVG